MSAEPPVLSQRLVRAAELARHFNVTSRTINRWSDEGLIPPPAFRHARLRLYNLDAVLSAVEARKGVA